MDFLHCWELDSTRSFGRININTCGGQLNYGCFLGRARIACFSSKFLLLVGRRRHINGLWFRLGAVYYVILIKKKWSMHIFIERRASSFRHPKSPDSPRTIRMVLTIIRNGHQVDFFRLFIVGPRGARGFMCEASRRAWRSRGRILN